MACPERKRIIKYRRRERAEKEKVEKPWAEVVKKTTEAAARKEEANTQQLVGEMGMAAMVMVIDAHVHNFLHPGTFNNRISESFKLNNIAGIKLPETPDSSKLIQALGIREHIGKTVEREKKRVRSEEEQRPAETEGSVFDEVISEDEILDRHLEEEENGVLDATEIGIEILTTEAWCHEGMEPATLRGMVQDNRAKYRLGARCRYEPREIKDLIEREKISVPTNNAVRVSANIYAKMTCGVRYVPAHTSKKMKVGGRTS